VLIRCIPLIDHGAVSGAVVLTRDVSELRRRDRLLLSKDATIREIHHRVKNNLQTVAALLRLQARRLSDPAARAALEESVRRVGSIAVVHETLSLSLEETVAFDDIADKVLAMCAEVAVPEAQVEVTRRGDFGTLPIDLSSTHYDTPDPYVALSTDGRRIAYQTATDELVVRADRPMPLQVDGEDLGDVEEAHFEAERSALRVLVPE